jgi:hypothetical protein
MAKCFLVCLQAEQNPGMPDVPALDPQPEDHEVVQQGTTRAQPCADTPAPAPAPGAVTAEEEAARAEVSVCTAFGWFAKWSSIRPAPLSNIDLRRMAGVGPQPACRHHTAQGDGT